MFDKIIAYSIKNKLIIILFVLGLIGLGAYSLKNLPIDALPDITNNQVQIITTSPNLATQEVELFITYPIELAVKSIPYIIELRSISRFGLSLVTVVFEEDVDIYWARNQITERLNAAKEEIPVGFGSPILAPISTGLGEIYQYTVSAKEGYEETYDIMELRSIQDWIIVPQILGTKGVAEVNTLGGIRKEYEVAVNPDKLKSMDVTMVDIYEALQKNNENTGGAYIDKKPNAYYIRSIGMVNSLSDIEKIVVTVNNEIPVLIRDIATVQFGATVRYGATTRNGNGEVVNGMVMMLKGQNSAEIVNLVRERINLIEESLPEGVQINPYLDRSKLVNRAISTVRKNLIEGALIVIFILVLLIGNWRAGLIVASVIPLSLLFAVSCMRLFGVSGNLMSLGAIDFGLIVDGAVIIVEAIIHRLHNRPNNKVLSREEMDQEVYTATSNIRDSAAFGEIIILIVYLPILALVGIEGRMFTPMAQTVAFAILGAFILSLSYVPMMSALFLSKKIKNKKNVSDRIIGFFQKLYTPILNFALRFKALILAIAVALFIIAFLVFKSLGGEFIPTLSEGDIATHIIIPTGSSLDQEIHTTTKAEKLLLKNFPEIEQIVSKIGSAEVPTDPMPMEVADMMIIMKEKKEWTSAKSKDEMFMKMEKVLDDLPGVTTEFTQPIQMRFNELMTGVRSDVGLRIFGEDIDLLVSLGEKAVSIVQSVEGVEDARAETVSGLPQINIEYNKDKLALYGLNVQDLNRIVSMGFAGTAAGVIYEGEKKFDLVVRLAEPFRKDISHVENLYISLPTGNQIPLSQVASIQLGKGPAQISREEGKRRITVGFNVRGRDVESVVEEIHEKVSDQLDLPAGYYIKYTGQFENLIRASKRLGLAVPLALALIFILLYFTFGSIKQSVLIFTAIPLSAIGGVFALWLRNMPFSISAGIGFIALFGVAVLNGIVLIGYFNQLKKEGMTDIIQRIKEGTTVRLRPVIMTAAVASFGFLPMALSTSAGAEVQKPLATVVIGGLISATLLTLLVIPILYYFSEKWKFANKNIQAKFLLIPILSVFLFSAEAQKAKVYNVQQAIDQAMMNNGNIQAAQFAIDKLEQTQKSSYVIPKMSFEATFGQFNSAFYDQSYQVSQSFNPFLFKVKKETNSVLLNQKISQKELQKQQIVLQIRQICETLSYLQFKRQILETQKKQWVQYEKSVETKLAYGESNSLEVVTAQNKRQLIDQELKMVNASILSSELQLESIIQADYIVESSAADYEVLRWNEMIDSTLISQHPTFVLAEQEVLFAQAKTKEYRAVSKPDFMLGYMIHSIQGEQNIDGTIQNFDATPRFQSIQFGVQIPVFGKSYRTQIRASEIESQEMNSKASQLKQDLQSELNQIIISYQTSQEVVEYYESMGVSNAVLIEKHAQGLYDGGEISYLEYIQALNTSYMIQMERIEAIYKNNQMVHAMDYLLQN